MIKSLIERRTPQFADFFLLEKTETDSNTSVCSYEPYEGKVLLRGDCGVSMAVAYYAFLRENCAAFFTVDHALAVGEFRLPSAKKEITINRKYRTCLEYTFFSCGGCWWQWERWENEIDYMAMNGVNLPLSVVGTEAVWFKTLMDCGMSEEFALASISGPAYWGWQLSNCFDGFIPQIKRSTVEARIALGRKIIEREKELGMAPLMQGFSGYLPRYYIKAKLRANLSRTDEWCKFPSQFQIAARDTHFSRIGVSFMKNQALLLGEGKYFLADPFAAHAPVKKDDAYLVGIGTAIFKTLTSQDENAVWVMHSSSAKEPMLRLLPHGQLLVIDNSGDFALDGCDYILGTEHNSGDVTALHGSLAETAGQRFDEIKAHDESLAGVGAFTDGSFSNECFRQFAMASLCEKQDVDAWLKNYATNRWHVANEQALSALALLKNSCYKPGQSSREHASVICARPSVNLRHTAIGDSGVEPCYNYTDVFAAAQKMLSCGGSGYEFELDVCDCLRQALSDLAGELCQKSLNGYKNRDVQAFEQSTNEFLSLIEELDRLLMTKKEFALPYRLQQAKEAGSDADESQNYEINLLAQITIFGPTRDNAMYDCCWKEWGGILKTFYAVRWRALFEMLALNFKKGYKPQRQKALPYDREEYLGSDFGRKLVQVEKEWIAKYDPEYEMVGKENTLEVAKELVEKYAPMFK